MIQLHGLPGLFGDVGRLLSISWTNSWCQVLATSMATGLK